MAQPAMRPALPAEAESVAALVRAAYSVYVPRMGQEPAPMLADYGELISRGVVYVVHGEGRLRGVLVMWPEDDHLFLENIAVHPDDQGAGLGRQLMQFVDRSALAMRVQAVELYTNEAMTENLAFYQRLGYVETGRRSEAGFRRVYMRKTLA